MKAYLENTLETEKSVSTHVVYDSVGVEEKLYFVVETEGSMWWAGLRHLEGAKIRCGKRHFEEIAKNTENPTQYIKVTYVEGMLGYVD